MPTRDVKLTDQRGGGRRARLKWLRRAVREGLDQIDRGEGMEFRCLDELEREIDRLGREASAELAWQRERA